MITLKEVATRAGVSIATVSYCVNGTKSVSAATRSKVMKAIEELNYVPNAAARSLKSESIMEIGVVFPDIDDYYRSEILKGIVDQSEGKNYSVTLEFSYNSPKMERKIINDFVGKNVRGLIIDTCQPENADYFRKNVLERNISNVFIEHCPEGLNVNFLAFDNYKSYYYLTQKLLEKGYERIAVVTGPWRLPPAYSAIKGYEDALKSKGKEVDEALVVHTDSSKESSFRETMQQLIKNPPQAVITPSESILKGALEAFRVCGLRVPEDICVLTLGEETWNRSNSYPGVLHTSRSAYAMGEQCTRLLLKDMEAPALFQKEFHLLDDNLEDLEESRLEIPEAVRPAPRNRPEKKNDVLRILATSLTLNSIQAIQLLAENFTLQTQIDVEFETCDLQELFDRIVQEADQPESSYDICVYDVSWLRYLANAGVLKNMTNLLEDRPELKARFMKKNLSNCYYHDVCYGVPIIGGTHLLFYRRDLFETPSIQRTFQQQHHLPLRPPATWTEFNGIAKFFTRKYNPDSPTLAGTAIEGGLTEDLTLEILVRLWSFGGGLLDENGKLTLNTPQNIRGFQSILETASYTCQNATETSRDKVFQDFGNGKIAMMISFSEYASKIRDETHSDIITKIGYSQMPGRMPANVGWNLGVNPRTEKMEAIEKFFDWCSGRQNSYYMTILSGQSAVVYPHKNHELIKLYPWLTLSESGQKSSRSRIYPYRGKQKLVKPREIELIIKDLFLEMQEKPDKISELLVSGQKRIEKLFS